MVISRREERLLRGLDLERLIEAVCKKYDVERGELAAAAHDQQPEPHWPTWQSIIPSAPAPTWYRSWASPARRASRTYRPDLPPC